MRNVGNYFEYFRAGEFFRMLVKFIKNQQITKRKIAVPVVSNLMCFSAITQTNKLNGVHFEDVVCRGRWQIPTFLARVRLFDNQGHDGAIVFAVFTPVACTTMRFVRHS